jgi:hypothetical protein
MRNIEDEEAEIIAKEAKRDDESELTYDKVDDMPSKFQITDVVGIDPLDNEIVQGMLAEKDYRIAELEKLCEESAKYFNNHDIKNHPDYIKLQEQLERITEDRDNLILENEQLKETARKLTKEGFKPAASFGGNLGQ